MERYNRRTRDEIDELLEHVPEQLLHVALEHRLMHAETFAYILHNVAHERKIAPYQAPPAATPAADGARFVAIPEGDARLGLDDRDAFGWDNEFGAHTVPVAAFSVAQNKVTNGDYLAFVREGAAPPFFWVDRAGRWFYRGMFSEYPLPLECPVYVTHDEAQAFARWRGMRLPTEAEYHRAASLAPRAVTRGRQFRFSSLGPGPRRRVRRARRAAYRQWLGMDLHAVRAVSRL